MIIEVFRKKEKPEEKNRLQVEREMWLGEGNVVNYQVDVYVVEKGGELVSKTFYPRRVSQAGNNKIGLGSFYAGEISSLEDVSQYIKRDLAKLRDKFGDSSIRGRIVDNGGIIRRVETYRFVQGDELAEAQRRIGDL